MWAKTPPWQGRRAPPLWMAEESEWFLIGPMDWTRMRNADLVATRVLEKRNLL